jgi:hypothetical protein
MSTFYMNWAAFEVPGVEVVDRTTYCMQIRHPEHDGMRLVVWHMEAPSGKTVRQLAANRLADEMARLEACAVLETRETLWCDSPALEVATRWRHDGAVHYQRQVHFVEDDRWRSFALAGPLTSRAACDACFEQIRTSLRMKAES